MGCGLQALRIAGAEQAGFTWSHLAAGHGDLPPRLARNRLASCHELHIRAEQLAQVLLGKRVVRAAEYQAIDLPFLNAKYAHSPCKSGASSYHFCSVSCYGAAFDGIRQAITGLQCELSQARLRLQQRFEFIAGQCAAGRHHANVFCLAQLHGGL